MIQYISEGSNKGKLLGAGALSQKTGRNVRKCEEKCEDGGDLANFWFWQRHLLENPLENHPCHVVNP